MQHTKLLYMNDSYLFEHDASFLGTLTDDQGRTVIILDQTILYPQDGGQPYDRGMISSDKARFIVDEVRFVDGIVHHIGSYESGSFSEGEQVHITVDRDRRVLNSKLQSGGHLIDMAVRAAGYDYLKPTKGYHFPDGPSVEYAGTVEPEKRQAMLQQVQAELDNMIATGYEVKMQYATRDQLKDLCYFVPEHLPEDKPIRIVAVWGDKYMPCGATHIKNISELKGLKITKVKCKSGETKISYAL